MSKDHIKSDLPVTTDWWNENVRDVYFNGCLIGQILDVAQHPKDGNGKMRGQKVLTRKHGVDAYANWFNRIRSEKDRFRRAQQTRRYGGNNPPDPPDYGDNARVVLLNAEGLMIFSKNNEIEERALQAGCDFIRSISSKLVEWIGNDDEMRNRFRTLLYSEMDKKTEFSSTFEFLIPQNELVYGSSFAEAMNECFLTFGRHVASWRNITWATLDLFLENYSPHEKDKEGIRFQRTVYLPGDGFDMTEPVNFTAYDSKNFSHKGPRKLTKCVLTIGRTFAEDKRKKKINTRPSFRIEE